LRGHRLRCKSDVSQYQHPEARSLVAAVVEPRRHCGGCLSAMVGLTYAVTRLRPQAPPLRGSCLMLETIAPYNFNRSPRLFADPVFV